MADTFITKNSDLSKITLPSGSTYDLKDYFATHYRGTTSTNITANSGKVNPIQLTPAENFINSGTATDSYTAHAGDLVVYTDTNNLYIATKETTDSTANVTWVKLASLKEGTVTNVTTGAGLTGGPITSSGTIKARLKSETVSTLTAASKGSTANKEYAVGLDKDGFLSVNVPWSNTTYDAGDGVVKDTSVTPNKFKADLASYTKASSAATQGSGSKLYAVSLDSAGHLAVNVPWTDANTTYTLAGNADSGASLSLTGSDTTNNGTLTFTPSSGNPTTITVKNLNTAAFKGVATSIRSSGATNDSLATEKAVADAISELPQAMIFRGTLGTGGTKTSLPTADASTAGDVYKVITAGTYASIAAKVGDIFVCQTITGTTTTYAWVLIPSGDEPSGTVTNVGTGVGLTGGPVTSSGTIKAKLKSETAATIDATQGSGSKLYAVGVDKSGYLSVNVPWTDNDHTSAVAEGVGIKVTSGTAGTVTTYTVNAKLKSETAATNDATATPGTNANREYAIRTDKSGYLSVNVPWTDNDHTTEVTGSNGITVDTPTTSGSVTTYNVKHSNSVSKQDTTVLKKLSWDSEGHITGQNNVSTGSPVTAVATSPASSTAPTDSIGEYWSVSGETLTFKYITKTTTSGYYKT